MLTSKQTSIQFPLRCAVSKPKINRIMQNRMRISYLLFLICVMALNVQSQVYSDRVVGKKNLELSDSIIAHAHEYPYLLPILGKKAAMMGFDLPYSAGLSSQYVWQRSELVITNLSVGFNNGPMRNLDEIIRFNNATAESNVLNVRPDIWLLPFLNVYGIFAKSNTSTAVDFGIWVPSNPSQPDADWKEVANFKTKAKFNGNTSVGFGLTPTIGIGGGWFAMDMNFSWTDVAALEKPAYVFNFGPRFGKSFRIPKHPQMNAAVWIGGFRVKYANETNGSLPIGDLIPTDTLSLKVQQGLAKVNAADQQVQAWWNGLSTAEKNNPVNKAKYETANRAIGTATQFLEGAQEALGNIDNATVQYSLDKKLKDMWNFIVGSQFQLNKHWMLRVEYGFLGTRRQFIGGLQYRFGL